MKKLYLIIICIGVILTHNYIVYAKDTVFSVNKYKDEKFSFIINSYNKKGKIDGTVVAGTYLKEIIDYENDKHDDYQILLVKYDKSGGVLWSFSYGKNSKDQINSFDYTYDELGNIDGYLLVIPETYNLNEENKEKHSMTMFLKISLDGKLIWEKSSSINENELLNKMIPTYDENKMFNGYISVGNSKSDDNITTGIIAKYDRECNLIWSKEDEKDEYKSIDYIDITNVYNNRQVEGYVVISKQIDYDNKTKVNLIKYNQEGNQIKTIDNLLEKYESYYLEKSDNGYILFGATTEVKLKKGEASYYIINYNQNDEEEWEIFGDVSIDTNEKIKLFSVEKNNEIKKYFLLYVNNIDSSEEVIKIDSEGSVNEKIKKINNEYYTISNFLVNNKTLYFVGQIKCPKDDSCDYNNNSLFLISDEDKVIEVKDKDSKNIIVILIVIIIISAGIIIKQKRSHTSS